MYRLWSITLFTLFLGSTALAQRVVFTQDVAPKAEVKSVLIQNARSLSSVQVSVSVPSIEITRSADGFKKIEIDGLSPTTKSGKPALYAAGSLIAVPTGYEPRLTVVNQDVRTVPGVVVEPFQIVSRCGSVAPGVFAFDSELYESNEVYPANNVELQEVGNLQGLRLVRVAVNPIQADLENDSLRVTTDLKVRVDLVPNSRSKETVYLTRSFYQLARTVTANGYGLRNAIAPKMEPELMLILTADELKDELGELVAWQQSKGFNVKVVTRTEAGGYEDPMKDYIQKMYDEGNKPSYLIFVGNETSMPPFRPDTIFGDAASDYPFALLSGEDEIPDALYGRIVADNKEDVQKQISRWINYERSPMNNAPWYAEGLTIASDEGSGPTDAEYAERVAKSLTDHTYTNVDPFVQGNGATFEAIEASLNAGRTWLAYFGHGSGTSWGNTDGPFGVSHVQDLTYTEGKLPVIIDVACQNAAYDSYNLCFGKAWVTHQHEEQNSGAVAFYGGSVNISWHPPAIMSEGIAKYHFEKPVHSLGASVLAGQLYLIEQEGNDDDIIDNLEWYNLFGDPSMLIRTATPKAYNASFTTQQEGQGMNVNVKAVDQTGSGVAGLRVSLNGALGNTLAVGETNQQGEANLLVSNGMEVANSTLTLTGYNAETQQIAVK